MTWPGYTEPTLAEELAACRQTARDCQFVLALAAGVRLAAYEEAEAREAKARIAATLRGML